MHKRAFQTLKRTFTQVSGLHPAYFDLKNRIGKSFKSKYGGGRLEACINVRFRP